MEILDQEKSHFSCRVSGFSVLWKQTSGVTADLSTKQRNETQGSYLEFNSVIRATTVKQMGWESLESYQTNPPTRENVRRLIRSIAKTKFYHCRAGKWVVRVKRSEASAKCETRAPPVSPENTKR